MARLTQDFGQWRADRRVEAARIEAQLRAAPQLVSDAALDELDAEAPLARGARGGAPTRHTDASRLRKRFQARSHVDPITVDVIALDDHVTLVDADPKLD
jgi:hypothetical protein